MRWQITLSVVDCCCVPSRARLLQLAATQTNTLVSGHHLLVELMHLLCALYVPVTLLQAAVAEVLARQRLEACTLQALHTGALPLHSGQAPCAAVQFPYPELFTLTSLA
jgi:hypothetical protein